MSLNTYLEVLNSFIVTTCAFNFFKKKFYISSKLRECVLKSIKSL